MSPDYLAEALKGLRDFQNATVARVVRSLFEEGRKAMLVADEVGLGKTIVARGLIARGVQWAAEQGRDAYRVTYVCSNQAIATENETKLNPFPADVYRPSSVKRMAFLAEAPRNQPQSPCGVRLEINTMTPATSFESRSTSGTAAERVVLGKLLLTADTDEAICAPGLARVLRGGIGPALLRKWETAAREEWRRCRDALRPGLPVRFLKAIKSRDLPGGLEFPQDLCDGRPRSLFEALCTLAAQIRRDSPTAHHRACAEVVGELRNVLIEECVTYLNTDLFILDEFQRFKQLLDRPEDSEAARIANRAFSAQASKILLLSATPFKAFSGSDGEDEADAHYHEFRSVLSFLLQDDEEALGRYERSRRRLYRQLGTLGPDDLPHIDDSAKREIEAILRPVICRTERRTVVAEAGMRRAGAGEAHRVPVTEGDIAGFVAADKAVRAAGEGLKRELSLPVEYAKSAPFTLSFLRDYKLREDIYKGVCRRRRARRALEQADGAWVDEDAVNRYAFEPLSGNGVHGKLQAVAAKVMAQNAHLLLWVPPSLPYYKLDGAFRGTEGFTKTLVFSAWRMVPRMLASLLSYEVERLTVGDDQTRDPERERTKRRYSQPTRAGKAKAEPRHPRPLILFRAEHGGLMDLCLVYPSPFLAGILSPRELLAAEKTTVSVRGLQDAARVKLGNAMKPVLRGRVAPRTNRETWYWGAPALLDIAQPSLANAVRSWLVDRKALRRSAFIRSEPGTEDEPSSTDESAAAKQKCIDCLSEALAAEKDEPFGGPPPDDLLDVLLDVAMASPGVCALRALQVAYPEEVLTTLMTKALEVAGAFVKLFNKPEAIAAVRLAVPGGGAYWRRVLTYCRQGCLASVLDEYVHLLKEQHRDLNSAVDALCDSVNVRTATVLVDGCQSVTSPSTTQPLRMRSHFAVDFGSQRITEEEGENRVRSLRESFNSPFRPFVLASTSIGQEGLDFHRYCRRVVHWNLPSNPIDLEQREGRVDRYKCLAVRQGIAKAYGALVGLQSGSRDLWDELMAAAVEYEHSGAQPSDLVPYWVVTSDEAGAFPIERIVPVYPCSREADEYDGMLRTLASYRLTFGQPRQAELVRFLHRHFSDAELAMIRQKLMIDLCPFRYGNGQRDG